MAETILPPSTEAGTDAMTLDELARRMNVSYTTAHLLAQQNALPIPAVRVGRQYRFSRRAYEALMAAQHQPRPDEAA